MLAVFSWFSGSFRFQPTSSRLIAGDQRTGQPGMGLLCVWGGLARASVLSALGPLAFMKFVWRVRQKRTCSAEILCGASRFRDLPKSWKQEAARDMRHETAAKVLGVPLGVPFNLTTKSSKKVPSRKTHPPVP